MKPASQLLAMLLMLLTSSAQAADGQNTSSGKFTRGVARQGTVQTEVFDDSKGKYVTDSKKPPSSRPVTVTVAKPAGPDTKPATEMKKPAQPFSDKPKTSGRQEEREGGSKARPPR